MPSFGDTALIALLALLLFGPKKLPELARQLGKLMGEFRRASNEFRMQMEDELRIAEQAESQKKIEAMQAAAPVAPALAVEDKVQDESIVVEHPHMPPAEIAALTENSIAAPADLAAEEQKPQRYTGETGTPVTIAAPLSIATSGELHMMPPSTGLPVSRSALSSMIAAIPHTADPETEAEPAQEFKTHEASLHG